MEAIRYKHSRNSGDLVAAMAGMQQVYKDTGKKAVIYQRLGLEAYYYDGAKHPLVNEEGNAVCMNQKQWDMLAPLLLSQEYVFNCDVFEGQAFDIDLDRVMHDKQIPMPSGDLHFWNSFIVPEMACDLSKKWLDFYTPADVHVKYYDKIVINRTERYNNPHITYYFLKQYEPSLVFAGTENEKEIFCKQWELVMPLLEVSNFLELAQVIDSCKFGIYNQSMCWHISDSIKAERILEYCPQFPNTHPTGANGYAFIHQQALELYVHKLFNS